MSSGCMTSDAIWPVEMGPLIRFQVTVEEAKRTLVVIQLEVGMSKLLKSFETFRFEFLLIFRICYFVHYPLH